VLRSPDRMNRQRRGEHDRIAHGHVAGCAAELVARPRHRHHPHRSGKFGNVECDFRPAVGADADDAGIERDRRLGRRAALELRAGGVAAAANLAAGRLHAVDELAVEVAHVGAEPALAEIVIVGRGRLVVRQVENADIDGGNDEAGLFAGEALDPDRHPQGRAGPRQRGQIEIDRECLSLAVDGEPLHADGAAGHALGRDVERAQQGGQRIAAIAPVASDRDADLVGSRLHLLADGGDETVGDDVEHQLAGGPRGDRDHHGVAGAVFGLVERGFQEIGGCRHSIPHRSRNRMRTQWWRRCRPGSTLRDGSGPRSPEPRCGRACRRRRRRRRRRRAWFA
jgi:hypothetical protein